MKLSVSEEEGKEFPAFFHLFQLAPAFDFGGFEELEREVEAEEMREEMAEGETGVGGGGGVAEEEAEEFGTDVGLAGREAGLEELQEG
jgi:hypothetical protein